MDTSFDETFALAADREKALQQLIPGTEDYYYYHCLHHEQQDRPAELQKLLETWVARHGWTARAHEISRRRTLLALKKDPAASFEQLRRELGLSFDHEPDVEGRAPTFPTRLDPDEVSRKSWRETALSYGGSTDLAGFSDAALDSLVAEKFEPERRRALLQRLKLPDVPGLVDLVLADLKHKHSSGFGSLPIHGKMTRLQLEELSRKDPNLLKVEAFIHARLLQLHDGAEGDPHNPDEKAARLKRLWAFVEPLAPAFNALKAHVLYHQLDFDRSRGVYDRKRFEAYLQIPRQVPYAAPKYIESFSNDPARRGGIVSLGRDFGAFTQLPAVATDEALVADCCAHFFVDAKDVKAFDTWILESWLKIVFAETKILHGVGDMEQWYSLLNDPARIQALKNRVEVSFPPHNRTYHGADEPVTIDVDVKNVPTLVVKVFEINTLNVFLARGEEVDTSLDLDGLVAAEERVMTFTEPPARRVRRTFEFPTLARPGVFVVEFIGGGISSRALIRKGRLHFIERCGSAGHVFTILDEALRPLKDASLWMAGREYVADKDGAVAVPFSTRPGRQAVLLRHGSLTTLESFEHRAETYQFSAGIYADRESLLRRAEARVLLRPSLRVHGSAVSLALLEDPVLLIRSTDRQGVESTMELRGLDLGDDRETVVPFQVPEDLLSLTFTLRGRVESLSLGRKEEVADERTFTLNGIETTEKTEDLHLARTGQGWVLHVLGKSGEARAGVPVTLTLRHRHTTFGKSFTLQTDARGRVELGSPEDLVSIEASLPSGGSQSWTPSADRCLRPGALHVRAGEPFRLPFIPEKLGRESVALLETAQGRYRADCFASLSLKEGFLNVAALEAGDYELHLKDEGHVVLIRVSGGTRRAGWLAAPVRLLEETPQEPVWLTRLKLGRDELQFRVENATPATRVHVFGTRWLPGHSVFHELGREGLPRPGIIPLAAASSAYVSGRDIGDEYRYILERKQGLRRPGVMLTRPGLLLNPWAVRGTETATAEAAAGEAYASMGAPAPCAPPACAAPERDASAPAESSSCLDFLAHPAALLVNLRPGKDGTLAVPRSAFAHANQVRIVVVDSSGTAVRDVFLPECTTEHQDLRLRLGLDPALHFTEKKDVAILEPGATLEIADLTTTKLETFDTLGAVFRLYRTLSGLATLDAFEFITRWNKLPEAEKRAKYGEFACHELHLFLSRKDPDFFKSCVQPYLRNKKDKTFLDRSLLGDDLAAYRRPWEFGRLNIVERILLGRRVADEHGPVARHVTELAQLLVRDRAAEARLFDTALKGKALETGDSLGMGAATAKASAAMEAAGPSASLRSMAADSLAEESCDDREMDRPAPKSKKAEAPRRSARGRAKDQDLERRREARALYRSVEQTQEWAENNYYKLPLDQQGPELVTVNRFWRDFAAHDGRGPFLSPHFAEASRNLTEILCALAVLDLPFEAGRAATSFDGPRMSLKPQGRSAVFHRQIRPAERAAAAFPILVSQNFLRDDDRTRSEGEETFDKYVTEEFLVHTVYTCQVVLTNPTSSSHKLDLLLQIPVGALPAKNGFVTRGVPLELAAYATETLEYAFYFPVPGTYPHYPVHVARNEQLVTAAPAWPLKAVSRLTQIDTTSWEHVSQYGSTAETLKFLKEANVERLDLGKTAWRMKDKAFHGPALDLLAARHAYNDLLWSYTIFHKDAVRLRDYLLHQEDWLRGSGLSLESPALSFDAVERRWHEHLEYAPLVNARAHRLGAQRRILNTRFAEQYQRLMSLLRYRAKPDPAALLAVAYYLFLQDRVEEALGTLDRVKRDDVETKLQYDYLKVYAEFLREKPAAARLIAERHQDHPVDRWRKLFQNALAQLDEIEGDPATVSDAADRDQQQGRLAATAATFDLTIEQREGVVAFQNLERVRVNYYRMDLELLFSRQPFVQEQSERFSFIMPNRSDEVVLSKKGGTQRFALPAEFNGANVVVELVAGGRRVSRPCFAHELGVQVVEAYGQLRVTQLKTRKPLPKTYVKVFARGKDGSVRFFKDGYTDLRGRFEYAALSTDDLDRVDRFALLVMSDAHGAVVQEASAPKR